MNYKNVKPAQRKEFATLPAGLYVGQILKIEPNGKDKYGKAAVNINFDICEGEYKDFYKKAYAEDTRENKAWGGVISFQSDNADSKIDADIQRRLSNFMFDVENDNGVKWNWDALSALNGAKIGFAVHKESYISKTSGKLVTITIPCNFVKVESARNGSGYIAPDRMPKAASAAPAEYSEVSYSDSDLPF